MRDELLHEAYAKDKKSKLEIYKYGHIFDLYLLVFDKERGVYCNKPHGRHLIDTLEDAKNLGTQLLYQWK